jgi:stress response protein YsnF
MTNDTPEAASDPDTLALLEETARVEARPVTLGRVRVSTHTETVEDVARAELRGETVEVTRVRVDRPVTGPMPSVRQEGDITIVPVFEEVLVVEKRLMLKEELHIRRRVTTEAVSLPVSLRRQTATIDRTEADK